MALIFGEEIVALACWGCAEGSESTLPGDSPGANLTPAQVSRVLQPPSGPIASRFVTHDPGFNDYRPTFSPDDGTIVLERNTVGNHQVKLHKVSSPGGPVTFLLNGFGQNSTRPDWSLGSNRIAFTAENSAGGTLWVCNPDGSSLATSKGIVRKVQVADETSSNLTEPTVLLAGDSAVSPDGRWLTLAAQADVNAPYSQATVSL